MLKRNNFKTKWKNKYFHYIEASNFHNKVRDILLAGTFRSMIAYQEVPLEELLISKYINTTNYSCDKMRIDWYIETLNICIEIQGRQHYIQTNFGHQNKIDSNITFIESHKRDINKKAIIEDAGFHFLEILYTEEDDLCEAYLTQKINEVIRNAGKSK